LLHLLLLFALFLFNAEGSLLSYTVFVVIACQVVLLLVILLETTRLHILGKKLYREEWLPCGDRERKRNRASSQVDHEGDEKLVHAPRGAGGAVARWEDLP